MQRFKERKFQDIRAMIQELTPVEETRAGRELIKKGIERGIERGIEQGIAQGERGAILVVLEARLGTLPATVSEELARATGTDHLRDLQRTAATCASLDEFVAALRNPV